MFACCVPSLDFWLCKLTISSDVLPWQCHARNLASNDVLFVDVDYPDLIHKKRAVVLQTPELRELLGDDYTLSDEGKDGLLLRSTKYCQLGCDLRQLDRLRTLLGSIVSLPECAILFVAEVSITYMDTHSADALIEWGSTVGRGMYRHPDLQQHVLCPHLCPTHTPPGQLLDRRICFLLRLR